MGNRIHSYLRGNAAVLLFHLAALSSVFLVAHWLRQVVIQPDPALQGYLQIITGLLGFVFAAVTLVRFQGTQDRIALILGAGFLLSGTVLTATSVLFFEFAHDAPVRLLWAPMAWWVGRMILALLFATAILVERFLPRARNPHREIAGAMVSVVGLTYVITIALRRIPPEVSQHPLAYFPSPQQLLPGFILLISLIWYRKRLGTDDAAFDRSIYAAAWLNLGAQLSASQSERLLDAPFVLAQALTVLGYTLALGGALLDNARLFESVRHLAVSDPLTGLANYRKLLDVLENESDRSNRSGRPFSLLLLDLDGLKKINDTHGHLVGSRAICRLADVLRIHCRSVDTAARYGGDEFALVLPETQADEAERVANRIRERMGAQDEQPSLSASIGISVYRGEGERIEKLLAEADRNLYVNKERMVRVAAAGASRGTKNS